MRRWVRYLMAAIVVVPVVLLLYGTPIEPRFVLDVRRLEAEMPGLEEPWSGSTVAMFSDLQVGMWFDNTDMVERVVDRTLDVDPDLVLLGGDFLYSADPDVEVQVETVLELLAPLTESGVPIVAVLGNHDHAVGGANELTAALQGRGIEVLQNDVASVPRDDRGGGDTDPLHVVGLAGRIHCDQIALPGSPHWSYLRLTEEEAWWPTASPRSTTERRATNCSSSAASGSASFRCGSTPLPNS